MKITLISFRTVAVLILVVNSTLSILTPVRTSSQGNTIATTKQSYTYPLGPYGQQSMRYLNTKYEASFGDFFTNKGTGTPLVCIHGFGGNADQFRKNLPVLAENGHNSYAIDLLGYGYSDKVGNITYSMT